MTPGSDTLIFDGSEDRYSRQSLIPWWDQGRVRSARVLVIGAGALGNEILKLLALTGIGNIAVCDMDRVEVSNLGRAVLFRFGDEGQPKVEVAARRLVEMNGDIKVRTFAGDIRELGLGLFVWADVVVCGLDNRLARLFVNECCARTGRVWVDGAIESLSGEARVFDPAAGACYACTMGETDWRLIRQRRSCAMLIRDVVEAGHVPTTAVAASLVGALQAMEAVKFLHGQPVMFGGAIRVEGLSSGVSRVSYPRKEDCQDHVVWPPLRRLERSAAEITAGECLEMARREFGADATVDFSRTVIVALECSKCGHVMRSGRVLGCLREREAACSRCSAHCAPLVISGLADSDDFDANSTLAELGAPLFDLLRVRTGMEPRCSWLLGADEDEVLRNLEKPTRYVLGRVETTGDSKWNTPE